MNQSDCVGPDGAVVFMGNSLLIDDYARRSLDAQREWLDAVQEELERQQ
jgi:hypothetical protein